MSALPELTHGLAAGEQEPDVYDIDGHGAERYDFGYGEDTRRFTFMLPDIFKVVRPERVHDAQQVVLDVLAVLQEHRLSFQPHVVSILEGVRAMYPREPHASESCQPRPATDWRPKELGLAIDMQTTKPEDEYGWVRDVVDAIDPDDMPATRKALLDVLGLEQATGSGFQPGEAGLMNPGELDQAGVAIEASRRLLSLAGDERALFLGYERYFTEELGDLIAGVFGCNDFDERAVEEGILNNNNGSDTVERLDEQRLRGSATDVVDEVCGLLIQRFMTAGDRLSTHEIRLLSERLVSLVHSYVNPDLEIDLEEVVSRRVEAVYPGRAKSLGGVVVSRGEPGNFPN